mgnify:CR=1 FL=1
MGSWTLPISGWSIPVSPVKVDFALEKSEIAAVTLRGKLGVTIRAKDGTSYVINTIPAKKTAEALAQLGIPVEG